MKSHSSTLLAEVRSFRQNHPDVRYVDLIALDIPGHFYGKRYPVEMLEKVAAGSKRRSGKDGCRQCCESGGTADGLDDIAPGRFHALPPLAALRRLPVSEGSVPVFLVAVHVRFRNIPLPKTARLVHERRNPVDPLRTALDEPRRSTL